MHTYSSSTWLYSVVASLSPLLTWIFQWNGYALEAHEYYSIFWCCFCCLDWRAQGPRHCTELIVTPAFAELTAGPKPLYPLLKGSYVTVYVRARCFVACGHAVTGQNLVFLKFMIQMWWIYLPDDLALCKWFGCLQLLLRFLWGTWVRFFRLSVGMCPWQHSCYFSISFVKDIRFLDGMSLIYFLITLLGNLLFKPSNL